MTKTTEKTYEEKFKHIDYQVIEKLADFPEFDEWHIPKRVSFGLTETSENSSANFQFTIKSFKKIEINKERTIFRMAGGFIAFNKPFHASLWEGMKCYEFRFGDNKMTATMLSQFAQKYIKIPKEKIKFN